MSSSNTVPVDVCVIPARTAKAFLLAPGDRIRVIEHEGLQVADLNVYAHPDMREYFSAAATRRIHGRIYVTVGDELWSNPGRDRPLLRITQDTVSYSPQYARASAHSIMAPRCTTAFYERRTGLRDHDSCQNSLARSIAEFGLGPDDTHDTLSLFMKIGIDESGRSFHEQCEADKDDHVELLALVDCVVNVSACPSDREGGAPIVNGGVTKPLRIEIQRASGEAATDKSPMGVGAGD